MNHRARLAILIVAAALLLGACADARAAIPVEPGGGPVSSTPVVAAPAATQETLTASTPTAGRKAKDGPQRDGRTQGAAGATAQAAAPILAPEILGRPTDRSITLNLLPSEALDIYVEYGAAPGVYSGRTAAVSLAADQPAEITVDGLQPDTRVYYRIQYREPAAAGFVAGEEKSFYTQRAPGSRFTFDIQGDSHPERVNKQFDAELYTRALTNVAADRPDFYFTIGDDFSVDTLKTVNAETVSQVYARQRQWLGQVGAPVFLVNGNHEQAALANLDGTPDNVAVWAQAARNAYYPQPAPDGFYTGDAKPVEHIGLLRDYYAFTWGDALFIVIDPYWHSPEPVDNVFGGDRDQKAGRDLWLITLGEEQYQWFKQTLETSSAKYKFVFAHHVNGTGRGGAELAGTYEWGDIAGFPAHRPGWEQPIHQLMADNGVTILFQGHDHLFAKQELDGVIYQTLPEPADPFYTLENGDAYKSGEKLPNSGHLRVTVAPEQVTVDYVSSVLPADEKDGHKNGEVAHTYTVGGRGQSSGAKSLLPLVSTSSSPGSGEPQVTPFPGNVVLGSPTGDSITASLLSDVDLEVYLEYGATPCPYTGRTAPVALAAGDPEEAVVSALAPDTAYKYRVRFRAPGASVFSTGRDATFHTQRAPGSTFTFTLDADPHNRDPNFNAEVYGATLHSILADEPDFHIDLGDTFMTEKLAPASFEQALPTYREMRGFFGMLEGSTPLFLVNGNHDGEWSPDMGGKTGNLAVWATQARRTFYPNPVPGGFYSGSTTAEPGIGVRDGYYAWTWGDALFVVLDPYWYSTKAKPGDNWGLTLGDAQYQWLKRTLETSTVKYKLVFSHNLVGGQDQNMRGGVEAASLYEWGGNNADGSWGFADRRPGWSAPIHQLMADNQVTIFFHGHDHLFVRQDLDGVVYQEVPQPSYASYDKINSAVQFGYRHGEVQGCCGFLRVTVSPAVLMVDYVRSYLPQHENAQRQSGKVSYSYTITSR